MDCPVALEKFGARIIPLAMDTKLFGLDEYDAAAVTVFVGVVLIREPVDVLPADATVDLSPAAYPTLFGAVVAIV